MLTSLYIVLFFGLPIFIFIATLLAKKFGAGSGLKEESLALSEEEAYRTIPAEFLSQLRFMVRYSPVKKRMGSGETYVYLEEQLRYGNVALTNWIKHDVPIKANCEANPQVLRAISMLKQYSAERSTVHLAAKATEVDAAKPVSDLVQ
jgi:hypothetical protein